MPCQPCEGDGNVSADREHVFLRFIGGRDKVGKRRGRWRTYTTDRIYRTLPEHANFDAYPYWTPATEKEFCVQEEALTKAKEEAAIAKAKEAEVLAKEEATSSTASDQGEVASSSKQETDISVSGGGLTEEFGAGPTEAGLIRGMDDALLKNYIIGNGGKVDGRWGREKLIQEALKL